MILLMINIKTLFMLAVVCIIAVSCARILSRGNGNGANRELVAYSTVNADEFQNFIANSGAQLLDVRARDEYDEGHIAGAMLVDVNENDFVDKATAMLDKQRPVAVYCRSGRRSARAASLLSAQGYQVTNLAGGVMSWQDAGKSLVK